MDLGYARARKAGISPGFQEHILSGYHYRENKGGQVHIRDLSFQIKIQNVILPSGAEVVLLRLHKPLKNVLISLHGGPESYEGTEIRYLGLYRRLILKGWTIAILNYRGSINIKAPKENAWKNWSHSILNDYIELKRQLGLKTDRSISILGASFGGALALQIAKNFKLNRCLLLSPLLDLKTQQIRAGHKLNRWFQSRFSSKDFTDFSFNEMTCNVQTQVFAITSLKDEVLGSHFQKRLSQKSNFHVVNQNTTHIPKAYASSKYRYDLAYAYLTKGYCNR
jgi:esterase/lipase